MGLVGFGNEEVDAVVAGAGAVDADEVHWRVGSQKHVVPGTETIIDALVAIGHECLEAIQVGSFSGGAYDQDKRA